MHNVHYLTTLFSCNKCIQTSIAQVKQCKSFFSGEVIITNWKPIAVESICCHPNQDDKIKTVGEILLQFNTVPTLKITLKPKLPSLNLKELDQREHALSLIFQQYYRDLKLKAATEVKAEARGYVNISILCFF